MSTSAYAAIIESPVGMLGIRTAPNGLTGIELLCEGVAKYQPTVAGATDVVDALRRYFRDPRAPFALPLRPSGTAFQQRVWALLQSIPVGQTVTYASVAQRLATSARAVGQACRANPILIIVPCHRVVATHNIGGFMGGSGTYLAVKRWLLQHEAQATCGPELVAVTY
jgi:methylated-DNA-[protein]-cysteine S-methyltransferase